MKKIIVKKKKINFFLNKNLEFNKFIECNNKKIILLTIFYHFISFSLLF